MRRYISTILIFILIISLFTLTSCNNNNYPTQTSTYEDISSLIKSYSYNDEYNRTANINYEDYLMDSVNINEYNNSSYLSEAGVNEANSASDNKIIINNEIAKLNAIGGGIIIVDGKYKTGTITLTSNISIYIKEGCELISQTYTESSTDNQLENAVVYAKNASNISLFGPGKINGNGISYTNEPVDDTPLFPLEYFNLKERILAARNRLRTAKTNSRVSNIYFDNCSNINIQSLLLVDSASWTCKIANCDNVTITDTVIDNNIHIANTDGFDIVSSQDVTIEHCFVSTADDGLCVKANGNENACNIRFNRCTVTSMANCFKIGTETSKDISNVYCTNSYFYIDTIVGGYSGIAIESADGSNIDTVVVDNISMSGISSVFLVWLGDRLNKANGATDTVGSIKNVTISNITATNIEIPSAITGCTHNGVNYQVKDVTLANLKVEYRDTLENLNTKDANYEIGMSDYPEISRVLNQYIISHELSTYYDMPVYGALYRHVDGLNITNFNVKKRTISTLIENNIDNEKDRIDVLNINSIS